jgi:hypothetical protein
MTNLDRMKAHYQQIDQWHRKRGLDPHHQILTEPVMRHIERLEGRVQALEGALELDTMARLKTALLDLQRKYNELLFEVSTKFPHESRHETALRYIKQAEAPQNNPPQAPLAATGEEGKAQS